MARRLAGIVVAVIIVAAVGTLGYRMVYKTWWPQAPGRITYCGRIYETNHSLVLSRAGVTKSESRTSLPGDAPYPVVTVGRVPPVIGQPLLAARWCGVLNQWYSRLVATTTTRQGWKVSCRRVWGRSVGRPHWAGPPAARPVIRPSRATL